MSPERIRDVEMTAFLGRGVLVSFYSFLLYFFSFFFSFSFFGFSRPLKTVCAF